MYRISFHVGLGFCLHGSALIRYDLLAPTIRYNYLCKLSHFCAFSVSDFIETILVGPNLNQLNITSHAANVSRKFGLICLGWIKIWVPCF